MGVESFWYLFLEKLVIDYFDFIGEDRDRKLL